MKLTFSQKTIITLISSLLMIACIYLFTAAKSESQVVQQHTGHPPKTKTILPYTSKPLTEPTPSKVVEKISDEADTCRTIFKPEHGKLAWQRTKRAYIESLLIDLDIQGVAADILDEVTLTAGINLFYSRMLRSIDLGIGIGPLYDDSESVIARSSEYFLVADKVKNGDYDGLFKAIDDGQLTQSIYYPSQTETHFLIAFILDSDINNAKPLIDKLPNSAVTVHYSDLVTATSLNMPAELLNSLYLFSGLNANKVFKRLGKSRTLATIALESKHVELAHYWIDQGSPINPDPFDDNALDILAYHGPTLSQAERDSLFEKMAQTGLSTNGPTSFDDLKTLISPAIFNQYSDSINRHNNRLDPLALKKAQTITHQIHRQILDGAVDFDLDMQPPHDCFTPLAVRLTQLAMENPPQDDLPPVEEVPTPEITATPSFDERISKAKAMFNDEKSIISYLGEAQGLADKQAIEQYTRQQITGRVKQFRETQKQDPTHEKTQQTLLKVFTLATEGKWTEALALYNQLEMTSQDDNSALLLIALETNTRFDIIQDLLDSGAKLMPTAIRRMIINNNVQLAEKLLPYGLDIHYVEFGKSPLAQSVQNNALNMLRFLLNHGVEIDSHFLGFDALDIALQQFDLQDNGLAYVTTLIDAGAQIELSHKQIVNQMSISNMEAYLKLTYLYAELKL